MALKIERIQATKSIFKERSNEYLQRNLGRYYNNKTKNNILWEQHSEKRSWKYQNNSIAGLEKKSRKVF